jgi:peptidylprolyl isomerase
VLARTASAVVAAVLVAGALTACSGFSIDGDCEPAFESGGASSIVTATGDVGDTPAVEFPTPLISNDVQRTVLTAGSGEPAAPGSTILFDYVYFDGATGETLTADEDQLATASDLRLALGEALECVQAGSRVVVTGPVGEIDARGQDATDTVVAVIDVLDVFLGKANGINQLPQDGMPQVVTAVDGQPGITLTYQDAPTEPRSAVIKGGGGAAIQDGDTVIAHVRTWTWPTTLGGSATLGSDTWATGTPTNIDVSSDVLTDETLYAALDGAKVGSQLLVVIPSEDETSGATVFVLDILGIASRD